MIIFIRSKEPSILDYFETVDLWFIESQNLTMWVVRTQFDISYKTANHTDVMGNDANLLAKFLMLYALDDMTRKGPGWNICTMHRSLSS